MDLWEYVEDPESIVPTAELTAKRITINKTRASVVIQNTLSKVRQRLLNAGWDEDSCEPKYHWDMVLKVIPAVSQEAIGDLVVEFATINPERYKTLDDFLSRIQWLRRRLKELGAPCGETYSTWVVIMSLKKYPWQPFLKEKVKDGKMN